MCRSDLDDLPNVAPQVWWRSQAVAYIVRPNRPTMAAILALRMNGSLNHAWQNGQPQPNLTVPYPLTAGTISMHVRCVMTLALSNSPPAAGLCHDRPAQACQSGNIKLHLLWAM